MKAVRTPIGHSEKMYQDGGSDYALRHQPGSQSVGGSENESKERRDHGGKSAEQQGSASRGLEREANELRRGFYIFPDTSHKSRKAALIPAKQLGVYPIWRLSISISCQGTIYSLI